MGVNNRNPEAWPRGVGGGCEPPLDSLPLVRPESGGDLNAASSERVGGAIAEQVLDTSNGAGCSSFYPR